MANYKRTFRQILEGIEKSNATKLMRRARRANRIAKATRGRSRRRAYEVKARALSSLVERIPERAAVRKDIVLADFVVVELKGAESGLHMPATLLEGGSA